MPLNLTTELSSMNSSAAGLETQVNLLQKTSSDSCGVLGTLAATLGGAVKNAAKTLENGISVAFGAIAEISSFIRCKIKSLTTLFAKLLKKISSLTSSIISKLTSIINGIKSAMSGIVSAVSSLVTGLVDSIKGLAMSVFSGLIDLTKGLSCPSTKSTVQSANTCASDLIASVKASLSIAAPGKINQKALTDKFGSAINSALDNAKNVAKNLEDALKSQKKAITSKLDSSLKQIKKIAEDDQEAKPCGCKA